MEIENYEAVLYVCHYNGWTSAAEQTNQSPSTISKRVSWVERELGAPIFFRHKGSGVTLTPFGVQMLPYIRKIVALHSHVHTYANGARNENGGELTVGYSPLIGTVGEAEILSRFKFDNPTVQVNQVIRHRKDLLIMLQEGKIDCAFLFMVGSDQPKSGLLDVLLGSNICYVPVMRRNDVSLGVSENHPLARNSCVRISEFYNETFVFSDIPSHEDINRGALRYFFSNEIKQDIPVKIALMDFINKSMVGSFVAGGHGVLPTSCIPPDDLAGVRFLRIEGADVPSCGVFIYPKHYSSPAVKTLLQYVRAYSEERMGRL